MTRDPLPDGAWEEALRWWREATKDPARIASYKLQIEYVGGASDTIENSPRTRREAAERRRRQAGR